jgi:hypothetical protein
MEGKHAVAYIECTTREKPVLSLGMVYLVLAEI